MRPISTNPGCMEEGEYWLTHEACFVARSLEVLAVAGLLSISGCVLGAAVIHVFHYFAVFLIRRARAVSVDSVKRQRQPANLPSENWRPPIPTRDTIYCALT